MRKQKSTSGQRWKEEKEVDILGVMHEVGKESVQYRGPVICNFLNGIVNLSSSETTKKDLFKQIIRRFSKDFNEFSIKAAMIAKKSDNFI